jgi:hypothetical protein
MVEYLLNNIFGFLGFVILALIVKNFFPSYLAEKGKNLAQKEDIGKITDLVETVRTQHAKQIEEVRHQNQLILEQTKPSVALEIRRQEDFVQSKLEAYIDAITLMTKHIASVPMNVDGEDLNGRNFCRRPTELEINSTLGKLALFCDNAKILKAYSSMFSDGVNFVESWQNFISLAREDMKYSDVEIPADTFKYSTVLELPS